MANKVQPKTSLALTKNERHLLFWVLGGFLKNFALGLGATMSITLVVISWIALITVSKIHHLVYNLAAFSNVQFLHFLLVVGSAFLVITLLAVGFLWAFLKDIRDENALTDFVAYLKYRQRKRASVRIAAASQQNTGKAPPFVQGAASILDFGNTLNRAMPGLTPRQKDYLALKSDWSAVGNDLQAAIDKIDADVNQDKKGALLGSG